MKKKLAIGLSILMFSLMLLTGCSSGQEEQSTLAQMKKRGVMIVASSNDAPFAYIDKDTKKFSGIDAEIIQEIAKRLGVKKVQMKEVKFDNLFVELNNRNVDLIADAIYVKPERKKIADFTNIWYKEGEALVVLKDSKIKGTNDLADKVLGVQKGTTFVDYAQELKKAGKIKDLKLFNSQAELLLATNTKKIDASITDSATSIYSIRKDPNLTLKLVSPYTPHYNGEIAAVVRKGDTELKNAINQELEKLKKEGFVLKVLKKYGLNEENMVTTK